MREVASQAISPVIVIGMHRSGTSMLARVLQEFGVFMGRRRTRNEECRWTNRLNYWIFSQASATWERPEGMDALLAHSEVCGLIQDYLQGVVSGPACCRYLGPGRWLRYRSLFRVPEPWGWKDPRNTFTLPLWLPIFPRARVIHITRHGVDVAQSLLQRHKKAAAAAARRYRASRRLYVSNPMAPKHGGFAHNPRVADLEGGLELWEAYMSQGEKQLSELGAQALELRYEDLLRDPVRYLGEICEFLGLDTNHRELVRVAERCDPKKAYAYRQNEELSGFARSIVSRLERFGYTA